MTKGAIIVKEMYNIVNELRPLDARLMTTGYNHQSKCFICHKKIHKDVLRISEMVIAPQVRRSINICARCILLLAKEIELNSEDQRKAFAEWDKRLLMEAL